MSSDEYSCHRFGLTHAQYSVLASLRGMVRVGARPSQRRLAEHIGPRGGTLPVVRATIWRRSPVLTPAVCRNGNVGVVNAATRANRFGPPHDCAPIRSERPCPLVTGANGIGEATARMLAACGARVLITYLRIEDEVDAGLLEAYQRRRSANADDVLAEIRGAGGQAIPWKPIWQMVRLLCGCSTWQKRSSAPLTSS
jgi:hypothetical protein